MTWFLGAKYSLTYAILTCLWCTVMLEYWKIRQTDLSIRWNSKNVNTVKADRPQFRWERVFFDGTGEKQHYFPKWKQGIRMLLQIPFVLLSAIALGAIIVGVFALEIMISECYSGSYKGVVVSSPSFSEI